jgi:limonene-1,2-epoxide hydrolase
MSENIEIVRRFIAACDGKHMDEVVAFFTADAIYHNIPMDPVTGPEGVRQVLQGFADVSDEWVWELHAIAETADGVVLTERTDRIRSGGQWFGFPTMGAFELRDGKISAWRDYFDLQMALASMQKAAAAKASA